MGGGGAVTSRLEHSVCLIIWKFVGNLGYIVYKFRVMLMLIRDILFTNNRSHIFPPPTVQKYKKKSTWKSRIEREIGRNHV